MIADTCFLIDLMRKRSKALEKLELIEKSKDSQNTTILSLFELVTGIFMYDFPEKEKTKVLDLLKDFPLLMLDKEAAWQAGEILGTLARQGNIIDPIDALIAGISLKHKQKLVTRNQKHFARIAKLEVEIY